jgi:hypothetical protein
LASQLSGALIVTAELGAEDFAWLDALRRRHYPAERNRVPAHLTMFHALAPSAEAEVRRRLAVAAAGPAPAATVTGLMELDGGVAFQVASPGLVALRDELADGLHGLLSAQDAGGWRPHVTIQNKADPNAARLLRRSLDQGFEPRPLRIAGLGLHRYLGGAWESVATYKFRGR